MTDEVDIPEAVSDDDIKPETVEESARIIYEAHEAQADAEVQGREGADEADDEPLARESSGRARDARGRFAPTQAGTTPDAGEAKDGEHPGAVPGVQPEAQTGRLDAPARWSVPEKEAFNALPEVAKHQVLDFWSHMDQKFTKGSQDLARHRQRYGQIEEVVNHYLPQWNLKGMTDVQAISELCAAQDFLLRSPLEAMNLLCERTGVTPEALYQYRQSGGGQAAAPRQPQADPQISQLTQRVNEVYDYVQRGHQSAEQQAIAAGVEEVNAVRNLQSNGRYVYPELWNETYLVERVQPLVSALRKTQPGLPIGESVKRAVQTLRLLDGNPQASPSPNGSGLSREEIANVKRASVSVRGRGNGAYPTVAKATEGEKLTDSLEAVWDQLSSR
jgi:hypothetical protein